MQQCIYYVCRLFCSFRQKSHLCCLNSYNWPFEGNHNADMALSENEFDTPAVEYRHKYHNRQHISIRKKALLYSIYDGVTRRNPSVTSGLRVSVQPVYLSGSCMKSYQAFMCFLHIRCLQLFCAPFPHRISHFKILVMPYIYVLCSLLT